MWPNLEVWHFVEFFILYFSSSHKKTTLFNAPKQNVTISAVLHVNLIVQTFTSTPGLIFIQNSYLSVKETNKMKHSKKNQKENWSNKGSVMMS